MPIMKMTQKAISRLKLSVDKDRVDYSSVENTRLRLRVTKTGHKSWSVVYRRQSDGKQRRATLGVYPEISIVEAHERAAEFGVEVRKGADPAKATRRITDLETFSVFAERYLVRYVERNTKGAYNARKMLGKHVYPFIGKETVSELTKRDIIKILDRMVDVKRVPTMANRTFAVLQHMFGWSIDNGYLDSSPMRGLKKPAQEKSRDRYLNDEEIGELWTNLDKLKWKWQMKSVVRLLLLTGQRLNEVAGMRLSELHLDQNHPEWHLPAERSKNGKGHIVPLSGMAVMLIENALEAHKLSGVDPEIIFPAYRKSSSGQSLDGGFISAKFRKALPALGIEGCTPHDLRRTASTGMAKLGVDEKIIERILNHATGSKVAGIYNRHQYIDKKRHALVSWGAHIGEVAGMEKSDGNVLSMWERGLADWEEKRA